MHDIHFHLGQDGSLPDESLKKGIISTSNQKEFNIAQQYRTNEMMVSFGLHPWYRYTDVNDYLNQFQQCDLIGEIGLDCVWSMIPLEEQIPLFQAQLQLANQLKKAVVLHTKGCEELIATMIQNYPNTYLVHWYSCDKYIEEYIKLDCYFSIGPSVVNDEIVQSCVRTIPLDRLLLESDGMEAVLWARNEQVAYFKAMEDSLEKIAELRNISVKEMDKQLEKNYINFMQRVKFPRK